MANIKPMDSGRSLSRVCGTVMTILGRSTSLLDQVFPQGPCKSSPVEFRQDACSLGFACADNPVQTAVGFILNHLHNFRSGYSRRAVKYWWQYVLPRGNLPFTQSNIIQSCVRINADATEKEKNRFFQFIDSRQCLLQSLFIFTGTAQQKIMGNVQS